MGPWLAVACVVATVVVPGPGGEPDTRPPKRVSVLPVFFVPADEAPPSEADRKLLGRHMAWARDRYSELLRGKTFALARGGPRVYRSARPRAFYEAQPEGGAPQYVAELLERYRLNRRNCPYVFVVVFMSPASDFPGGGGRPINGGNNEGGGVVILSSYGLTKAPNFQSTLQHELGHAFGLPHVDVYGYDMVSCPSLMSYNPAHHTNGLQPSAHPGTFLPEDLRALALNQRAFPGLRFDLRRDVPDGYHLHPTVVTLGPMKLPGPWNEPDPTAAPH